MKYVSGILSAGKHVNSAYCVTREEIANVMLEVTEDGEVIGQCPITAVGMNTVRGVYQNNFSMYYAVKNTRKTIKIHDYVQQMGAIFVYGVMFSKSTQFPHGKFRVSYDGSILDIDMATAMDEVHFCGVDSSICTFGRNVYNLYDMLVLLSRLCGVCLMSYKVVHINNMSRRYSLHFAQTDEAKKFYAKMAMGL